MNQQINLEEIIPDDLDLDDLENITEEYRQKLFDLI